MTKWVQKNPVKSLLCTALLTAMIILFTLRLLYGNKINEVYRQTNEIHKALIEQ